MLLELSELLACPVCGPPQVMVAVVSESAGHRVERGFLGCPACDGRFPIEDGIARLVPAVSDDGADPTENRAAEPDIRSADAAVLAGAVLDLARGGGQVLLGSGLVGIADALAAVAERWEVVSLAERQAPERPRSPNVSRVVVVPTGHLPVLPGRFGAAALAGGAGGHRIRELASALGPLGRMAILAPGPGDVEALGEAGLEVIAADDRVAVASRRP